MYNKKTILTIITIFLSLIIFQVFYYINSEKKYKTVYEEVLIKEAKTYFENIMLKKAQGLDPKLTFTNELTNVKFELLKDNNKEHIKDMEDQKNKELHFMDDDKSYFYYYNLLKVQKNCINCHNNFKAGETAGVIKISIPTKHYFSIYEDILRSKYIYFILNILFTIIIITLIIWFLNRSKQKHLQLARSQRNLEKAEQMARLGHWRLDNRTGEITFSKSMKEVAGLKDETHINLKYILRRIIYQKDRFRVLRSFKRSLELKQNLQIEFQIIRQNDMKKRYVNCQIDHIKNCIDNSSEDNIIVSIGTVQDITKFISLRDKLSILEQAVEQAPISIVITDDKANIEYVNPNFTKVTGYELFEVTGKNPNILKSRYTDPEDYKKLWENISSGKNWSGTFKNIKKSGEEFWEMALISPVFSQKTKKISKYIAVKEEITSQVYLQEELKNKEEMLIAQSRQAAMGEMISMIAHQWRQPATVISLCASNILTDVVLDTIDKESLKKNSQTIIDQTEYLSETIDNFRNFFRPNKEKSLTTVKEIIEDTKGMTNATLKNSGIELIENYSSNKKINTYKKEFIQVLINIIKNSQEILNDKNIPNKIIKIDEYIKNKNVILQICDNAGGIEEKNIRKIFEPYFTTKDEKNGTGLGLYICKVIVEKHLNGTITAFNKDKGACFQITLKPEEE